MKCKTLIWIVAILIFASYSFSGCDQTEPVEATIETVYPCPSLKSFHTSPEMTNRYFDSEKKYRPTEEEVALIVPYMPIAEMVAILGKPHGCTPTGQMGLVWETDEGNTYWFYMSIPSGLPEGIRNQSVVFQTMTYGYLEGFAKAPSSKGNEN